MLLNCLKAMSPCENPTHISGNFWKIALKHHLHPKQMDKDPQDKKKKL